MRRQGQYGDPGAGRMHHMPGQRIEQNSGPFKGQLEAFTPEREQQHVTSKSVRQWRWERVGSKVLNSVVPQVFAEGQGVDASRSYFQGQRPDTKLTLEKQNNSDRRSRPNEEDMDVGYEDKPLSQTFEGIDQKFLDDIMKLSKEQSDAENARHKEKIKAINSLYEQQLAALRARHASQRDEFLHMESHGRQKQYEQAIMDITHTMACVPVILMVTAALPLQLLSDNYGTYKERARFLGNPRDHGFEPRGLYRGGRVYDARSRYY